LTASGQARPNQANRPTCRVEASRAITTTASNFS
jgi:hypothetical protein